MSSAMFIYIKEGEKFNLEKLKSDFEIIPGVSDINGEYLTDSLLACHYEYDDYQVTVRVENDLDTIYVKRESETSLMFALELQKLEERPLRIFDDSYSYNFSIKEIKSLEELKNKAYKEKYFDAEALALESQVEEVQAA